MIIHINDRLNRWVDWCGRGKKVNGLGYPDKVAFYRLAPLPSAKRDPVIDEECLEIDTIIRFMILSRQYQPLIEVIDQYYRHAGTAESHAKDLGISRRTLFNRLHQAHVKIMEYLQDDDHLTELHGYGINRVG